MFRRLIAVLSLLFITTALAAQTQSTSDRALTAPQVVSRWRKAVHLGKHAPLKAALLVSSSDEDGTTGNIEEWMTSDSYRRMVKRSFDDVEIVVTPHTAQRRDWNGFIRDLKGEELRRLRTAIFESAVLAFGPPTLMSQAAISQSDDRKFYLLRITPPGGAPTTWYVDAKTWLPAKSVHPGEDSEITTTYSDWREMGGALTPRAAHVEETDKPDYRWERTKLEFKSSLPATSFDAPKPGPSDTRLEPNAPPIPFDLESNHIVFKASLNGRPPIGFILDTGADQNVINETRLADFGLKTYAKTITTGGGGSAEYSYAQGATFTLPGVELRNQHVAALDQSGLERALGVPLGGLLGYDFISRFVIEIDYQKKLITLHDPRTWKYTGNGAIVPLTFDMGIPFMDGTIAVATKRDIPAFLVLDFGAAETMTLTSPFVKANDLLKLAQTNANVNRPAGLENQFFSQNNVRGHIDQLTLGKLTVQSIPVNLSVNVKGAYASSSFAGTVGESIYRRYHVFLDYARSRVIFEPTAEAAKPFPERQTYGLTLIASGADLRTFTVTAVRSGSPAEADGFKKGDVLSGFDRKPAAQFTLGELRDWLTRAGEHHELQVARGGDNLSIPIEIRLVSIDRK